MSTFNTSKSIFFPATNTLGLSTTQYLGGIIAKEPGANLTSWSCSFVFNYTNNNSQFNLTSNTQSNPGIKYMTLCNFGNSSGNPGYQICLKRDGSDTANIQIGIRYSTSNSSTWSELGNSFTSLNYINNFSSTDTYMILFSNGGVKNNNDNPYLYVVPLNGTTQNTASRLPPNSIPINMGGISQWGYGSSPENILYSTSNTGQYGYITTNGYNSFVSQNIQFSFIRSWQLNIPLNGTATTYGLFNTLSNNFSLFYINNNNLNIIQNNSNGSTPGTSTFSTYLMEFQLNFITGNVSGVTPNVSSGGVNYYLYNSASSTTNPINSTGATQLQNYTSGASNYSGNLNAPNNWFVGFNGTVGTNGQIIIGQTSTLACLLKGTKILTPIGYIPIENLKVGQKILTYNFKVKEILEIHESVVYPFPDFLPCIIPKGKFNAFQDLYLSPHHGILIGNKFHCAKDLETEKYNTNKLLHYFHIRTEDYFRDTLVANGVAVETYNGKNLDDKYYKNYKLFTDKFNQRLLLL